MCLPSLGSSVPAHRARGPCWSVWHWWALPIVNQVPWAAPVSCPLCPSEAMTPLCGSLSETWDFSSTRNSGNLQSLSGSPFPFKEVLKLSASCRNKGLPQSLDGCGLGGPHGWRPGLAQIGPQEVPAAIARVSQEKPRSCLSHGAEVPHSCL